MRIKERGLIFDGADAPANEKSCAFTSLVRLSNGDLLVGSGTPRGEMPRMAACG